MRVAPLEPERPCERFRCERDLLRVEPPRPLRALVDLRAVADLRPRIELLLLRDFPCALTRELDLLAALLERPLLGLFRALLRALAVPFRAEEPRDLLRDDDLLFVEVVGINV